MSRVSKLNGLESPLEVGKKINEIIEHGVGGGHSIFDIVWKDRVLTYEESEGLTLFGDYAYKNEVVGEHFGSPYIYEKCIEDYETSEETTLMTSRNFNVTGNLVIREDYDAGTSYASHFTTESFLFKKPESGSSQTISFKFKTGDDISTQQTLVSGGLYNYLVGFKSSKMLYYSSSNGTSWDTAKGRAGKTLEKNKWYNISISITPNGHLTCSIDGTDDISISAGTSLTTREGQYIGIFNNSTTGQSYAYPFLGELDLTSYKTYYPSSDTTVALYNYATVKKHSNGHVYYDVNTEAMEEIDKLYNSTGMAWAYGIDKENERIRIPRNDWYFMGGNPSNVGRMTPAGIPDVVATFGGLSTDNQSIATGAVKLSTTKHKGGAAGESDKVAIFDAGLCNSVYGGADTVQTKAVKLIGYMVTGKTFDDVGGSSSGGSSGGTTDYNLLQNIPTINDVTVIGNLSLDDLGIQPKGDYITTDSIDLSTKADVATTLEGYGIEDAYTKEEIEVIHRGIYTKTEVDTILSTKADVATTLEGYGIVNAYTKTEIDTMFGDVATLLDTINGEEV